MALSFRKRIALTLVPIFALLGILGGSGVLLLSHLGNQIDHILRENYDSVIAIQKLDEALEQIDAAFQFALAGRETYARQQFQKGWLLYRENLALEENAIDVRGEQELVDRLNELTNAYEGQGKVFFASNDLAVLMLAGGCCRAQRDGEYFGNSEHPGLLATFKEIKDVAGQISRLNQDSMEEANRHARQTAHWSLIGFAIGLAVAAVLAVVLAMKAIRTILFPVQAVTQSALEIGSGKLDQVVPILSRDELGQLARAFNIMARQLRDYRQLHSSQLQRAQLTAQATIDSFPDPVIVVDAGQEVEMANPAARRILGLPLKASGTPQTWLPPAGLGEPLKAALFNQDDYVPADFDKAIALAVDGQEKFYLPRILPIRDAQGETLGAAILFEDVTRFRFLDEAKSNLVATVSHELKTPLATVRLAMHLLLEEMAGPLTAKQVELLKDGVENTERLLSMINNLLDLARLEHEKHPLRVSPVCAADILWQAAEMCRPRALNKGIAIVVQAGTGLPPVAADVQQISRVLTNLIDNALNHSESGGLVKLQASCRDGQVSLAVADHGKGIPEEFLPRIFDKFFRVPGQQQESGTGLGLAIVREIVTLHGGHVKCASTPGKETVFSVDLPIWSGPRREEPEDAAEEPATSTSPP